MKYYIYGTSRTTNAPPVEASQTVEKTANLETERAPVTIPKWIAEPRLKLLNGMKELTRRQTEEGKTTYPNFAGKYQLEQFEKVVKWDFKTPEEKLEALHITIGELGLDSDRVLKGLTNPQRAEQKQIVLSKSGVIMDTRNQLLEHLRTSQIEYLKSKGLEF